MKIHIRPPVPPIPYTPIPKAPPTEFWLEMEAEELIKNAQQQRDRLKKLHGAWTNRQNTNEDAESETPEQNQRSQRNLELLV
jgi:hypothetical protein